MLAPVFNPILVPCSYVPYLRLSFWYLRKSGVLSFANVIQPRNSTQVEDGGVDYISNNVFFFFALPSLTLVVLTYEEIISQ